MHGRRGITRRATVSKNRFDFVAISAILQEADVHTLMMSEVKRVPSVVAGHIWLTIWRSPPSKLRQEIAGCSAVSDIVALDDTRHSESSDDFVYLLFLGHNFAHSRRCVA